MNKPDTSKATRITKMEGKYDLIKVEFLSDTITKLILYYPNPENAIEDCDRWTQGIRNMQGRKLFRFEAIEYGLCKPFQSEPNCHRRSSSV